MMGQSNTEIRLDSLNGKLSGLADRVDTLSRRMVRRDEIMAKLLTGEITTKQAVEMMGAADR